MASLGLRLHFAHPEARQCVLALGRAENEAMDLELQRPDGLEDAAWASIEDCLNRLQRAVRDDD
jgi:hypothetical protein